MRALEYLFNLKTNKASFADATGSVVNLKNAITGIAGSLNKVEDSVAKFAKSQKWANLSTLASNFHNSFTAIGQSIKGAFTGAWNFAENFAKEGDRIAKTSRIVGLSVKDYQGFMYAAERSGMSLEDLDSSLKKFNVTLGKAKAGDKTAAKIFDALLPKNVSEYQNSKDIILDVANAYTKLDAAQQAAVGSELFGRSGGLKMSEMLRGGSGGVRALLNQFEELGGGITDEMAKNAEDFADNFSKMMVSVNAMKAVIGGELLPIFKELFTTVSKYFLENRDAIKNDISNAAKKIAEAIKTIIPMIPKIVNGIVSVVSGLASVMDYVGPIKAILGVAILGSLGSVITLVTSLAGLLGGSVLAAVALVAGGIAGITAIIYQIYGNWDMLKSFIVDDVGGAIKNGISYLIDNLAMVKSFIIDDVGGAIVDVFDGIGKFISGIFNSVFDFITDKINAVKNFMKDLPIVGGLFEDSASGVSIAAGQNDEIAQAVRQGDMKGAADRLVVDFKNLPRGASVDAVSGNRNIDLNYGYTLGMGY